MMFKHHLSPGLQLFEYWAVMWKLKLTFVCISNDVPQTTVCVSETSSGIWGPRQRPTAMGTIPPQFFLSLVQISFTPVELITMRLLSSINRLSCSRATYHLCLGNMPTRCLARASYAMETRSINISLALIDSGNRWENTEVARSSNRMFYSRNRRRKSSYGCGSAVSAMPLECLCRSRIAPGAIRNGVVPATFVSKLVRQSIIEKPTLLRLSVRTAQSTGDNPISNSSLRVCEAQRPFNTMSSATSLRFQTYPGRRRYHFSNAISQPAAADFPLIPSTLLESLSQARLSTWTQHMDYQFDGCGRGIWILLPQSCLEKLSSGKRNGTQPAILRDIPHNGIARVVQEHKTSSTWLERTGLDDILLRDYIWMILKYDIGPMDERRGWCGGMLLLGGSTSKRISVGVEILCKWWRGCRWPQYICSVPVDSNWLHDL
ncbi:hypothetical protein BKA64DRAFT_777697 [Cadophora sp. MPI-SDFR-AT-0126]|nr:hypothetical protein BKA64DRAFT_777697 [Leotiomycetes sp. MPI-SDFR-AT-0126]